jgi:hypothetical protein
MLPVDILPRFDTITYSRCSIYCKRVQLVRLPKHLAYRRKHWYRINWHMIRYKMRHFVAH